MNAVRTVLLVDGDESHRRLLRSWLTGATVIEAGSRADAVRLMQQHAPSLVISEHRDFQRLLRDLEKHAPGARRAVLCPEGTELSDLGDFYDDLVAVAAQGYEFTTLSEITAETVQALLQQRSSARVIPKMPLTATFWVNEQQYSCAVIDISNDGISLSMSSEGPSAHFDLGMKLNQAQLYVRSVPVSDPQQWSIRSKHRAEGSRDFTVGVVIEAPRTSKNTSEVFDAVQIRGWLKRAVLRKSEFSVSRIDGKLRDTFKKASLSIDGSLVTLGVPAPDPRWEVGDMVRISFETGRLPTEGLSTVLASSPDGLVLARPRSATQRERRGSLRMPVAPLAQVAISFASPLQSMERYVTVLDLQPNGIAFAFDSRETVLPTGMHLMDAMLEISGKQIPLRATVQSTSSMNAGAMRRCGLKVAPLHESDRFTLLDALAGFLVPETRDPVSFDKVWQLFREEEYKFPDYPFDDPNAAATLKKSQLLLQRAPGIGKSFAYSTGGTLVGHSAGLRVYSGTWLGMHLLVKQGFQHAAEASLQLVNLGWDYGESQPDVQFLRGMWRVANRWPARIYGSIAPKLLREGKSYLLAFHHLRRPVTPFDSGTLRPRETRNHSEVLAVLRSSTHPIKLLSDDLTDDEFFLPTLSARFAAAGLHRARKLHVVETERGPRGWLITEEMSQGLFWIDLYSHYRFILADPTAPDAPQVLQALVGHAIEEQRSQGKTFVSATAPVEDMPLLEPYGFTDPGGTLLEFCIHRSMARQATSQLVTTLDRLAVRSSLNSSRRNEH